MSRERIIIVGCGLAGLTCAIELGRRLGGRHEIVVVGAEDEIDFAPALVWVPFGRRDRSVVSFLVRPHLERAGVALRHAPMVRLDLVGRRAITAAGAEPYDRLVVATGRRPAYELTAGLGPRGFTHSVLSWGEATAARQAFERFVDQPGPVVVGAVPGSPWLATAYEVALAMGLQLRKRRLAERAPLTFITPELALTPPGVAAADGETVGLAFDALGIAVRRAAAIDRIEPGAVLLADGVALPMSYGIVLPRGVGVDPLRACDGLVDGDGLIPVDASCRALASDRVFAIGGAAVLPPGVAPGVIAASGHGAEAMARVAAHNLVAALDGRPPIEVRPPPADAREPATGLLDHPGEHRLRLPGPEAAWARGALAGLLPGRGGPLP
jgi:sulfide:quinone oxidoreductase